MAHLTPNLLPNPINLHLFKYIVTFLLIVTAAVSVARAQSFAPAVNYTVGSGPQGVVTADFDRDGKLDLVTVNNSSANVSFLKGNGDGTFNTAVNYSTGSFPEAVATGDFNHDGFLDLVVIDRDPTNSYQTHSTLLGNGDGTFGSRISFGPGSTVTSIATGDFDGDSKDDLITLDSNVGVVVVRLSNGDGTFRVGTVYGIFNSTRDQVIRDFNRDGKLDVAVTVESSSNNPRVAVFLGNGDGTLAAPVFYPAAADFIAQISAGDLNGDGLIDLLSTSSFSAGKISFLRGNGDGTFQSRVDTVGPGSDHLAVADLDGDTKLDVIALRGRGVGSLGVLRGNGDGTLRLPFTEYGVNSSAQAIVTADLNGDGKVDLIVPGPPNIVSIHLNQTGPLSISGSITNESGAPIEGVTVNLTGATPIKMATGSNGLYSFTGLTNNGSYTVTPSKLNYLFGPPQQAFANLTANQTANFTGFLQTYSISGFIRDAAGDAVPGVMVFLTGGSNAVTTTDSFGRYLFPSLPGSVDYTVTPSSPGRVFSPSSQAINFLSSNRTANFSISVATFAINVSVQDPNLNNFFINPVVTWNGTVQKRGASTLFTGLPVGSNNTVTVSQTDAPFTPFVLRNPVTQVFNNLSSNQAANFEAKILGFSSGGAPNGIAAGDFNGDARMDIVVASSNIGRVVVMLGNGDGTLQSFTTLLNANGAFLPITGDFNRDGKLDIAVIAFTDNTVSVLIGKGDGTFQSPNVYPVPASPRGLDAGDLNGDGKIDLLTANSSGSLSVLLGNGDGTFQPRTDYSVPNPQYLTVGDVNGDGKLDAIAGTSVLIGNGDGTFVPPVPFVNGNPVDATAADFNGDGKVDLAVANIGQGMGIFFGKGDGTFLAPVVYPIFSPNSQNSIRKDDLNGDGKVDLVVTSSFQFTVFIGNGDGTFQDYPERSFGSMDPTFFAIADFNNDGLHDLIFGHNINLNGRVNVFLNQMQTGLQLSASNYSVNEGAGQAQLTVVRTGNVNIASTLTYRTIDDPAAIRCDTINGTAYARCDYSTTIDSLQFAPGETQKTLTIPLTDDTFVEGNETFQIELSAATGGVLSGKRNVTVTIVDNDTVGQSNPIFTNEFFVRQHYLDFLSREPEPGGFNDWVRLLANCSDVNNNPACDRVTVSSSFFGSEEFRLKGFYVFRFYVASLGRRPTYTEMISDMWAVTGQTKAEVFAKRAAFANAWVTRSEFAFYNTAANSTFVALLMNRYGLGQITTRPPSDPEEGEKITFTRADLSNQLDSGVLTRAQVLRAIVESDEVAAAEFNKAFVAMQYFGYLRRDPEITGYNNWLNYLDQHPGDFRIMVNGFVNSTEYRLRFGVPE